METEEETEFVKIIPEQVAPLTRSLKILAVQTSLVGEAALVEELLLSELLFCVPCFSHIEFFTISFN